MSLRLTGQLLAAGLGGAHQPPPPEQWGHFAKLDAWRGNEEKPRLECSGSVGSDPPLELHMEDLEECGQGLFWLKINTVLLRGLGVSVGPAPQLRSADK